MARSFNGSSDFITPTSATPLTVVPPLSVAVWVYPTAVSNTTSQIIMNNQANTNFWGLYLVQNTAKISLEASGSAANSSVAVSLNTWSHIGGSTSGTSIYLNGAKDGSATGTWSWSTITGGSVAIGEDPVNSGRNYTGRLADLAVWNVVLTDLEFAAIAKGVRPFRVRPKSLIAYYPLDGLQSPEPDLSGNASNGTLTGTAKAFGPPIAPFTSRMPLSTQSSTPVVAVFRPTLSPIGTRAGSRQMDWQ